MDELELLKKDWQQKKEHLPKLSYDEIYKMTWKKSSSIVKWILIISILELVIPNLLYLIPSIQDNDSFTDMGNFGNYFMALNVVYYLTVLYFIYQFYKRYKEISVLDDAKSLMRKIIKVRKPLSITSSFVYRWCCYYSEFLSLAFIWMMPYCYP